MLTWIIIHKFNINNNGHTTSISTLNNNINSLSSYSYLNISENDANLNGLYSYSYLNISGNTAAISTLNNKTNFSNLLVSNTLNVSGITIFI